MIDLQSYGLGMHLVQYNDELDIPDNIFAKGKVFGTYILSCTGCFYYLFREDIFKSLFKADDFMEAIFKDSLLFLYISFTVLACIFLLFCIVFLIKMMSPRHYHTPAKGDQLDNWYKECINIFKEDWGVSDPENDQEFKDELKKKLISFQIEATTHNRKINKIRMSAYKTSFTFLSLSITAVFIQWLFYLQL